MDQKKLFGNQQIFENLILLVRSGMKRSVQLWLQNLWIFTFGLQKALPFQILTCSLTYNKINVYVILTLSPLTTKFVQYTCISQIFTDKINNKYNNIFNVWATYLNRMRNVNNHIFPSKRYTIGFLWMLKSINMFGASGVDFWDLWRVLDVFELVVELCRYFSKAHFSIDYRSILSLYVLEGVL